MKISSALGFLFLGLFQLPLISFAQQGYTIKQVPLGSVKINDNFWSHWQKSHTIGTIPNAISQIRDSTHRLANFEIAAGVSNGKYSGLVWDDSDVYKVMEGMAYSLQNTPNPELEKLMDHWIDLISKSQEPNGYLVTFYMLNKNDDGLGKNLGMWSDIGRHEMYDGGHLIEAAVAYYKATGKRTFLDVAIKLANNWIASFGPDKRQWVDGHQEAELALVKLYNETNDKRYLDFAHWLLEQRGRGILFGPMTEGNPKQANENIQNEIPVRDLTKATGHAVRAMYMYSGMADVLANSGDSTYLKALNAVWDDVMNGKIYVTGGVGQTGKNEGFDDNYVLPNKTAYCETCAGVGMVIWSSRMNRLFGDAKYVDVLERTMYNAALAGVSLSGVKVNYTNPLESDGNHHRGYQYGIACCPTNVARFLPSIGEYVYATKKDEVFVNLYVGSESKVTIGSTPTTLTQKTNYPWDGKIDLIVNPESAVSGKISLRIPDWCKSYTVKLNNQKVSNGNIQKGYLTIDKEWKKGDVVSLDLDMPVIFNEADPKVKDDVGRRAVQKGPLVYALEQADNKNINLDNVILSSKNKFNVVPGDGILKGINKLQTTVGKDKITFIPYYAWDNREPGRMIVWTKFAN
jgi:DUF1680 family protein